jgi:SAM-dependent methyltransferase
MAAELLRSRGATRLCGVELDASFAQEAESRFDEVLCGSVEDHLPWPPSSFDTIVCYDVLEHLVDPWLALRRLAALIRPAGRIHVSVPNGRHPGTWLPIVVRGTMDYRTAGLRDITHLRFFGRRDLRDMCLGAGLEVIAIGVAPSASRTMNLALRMSFGRAAEFAAYQWHAIATRPVLNGSTAFSRQVP